MSTNEAPRWGVIAALVAGSLWSVASLLSLATPDPTRYLDALVFVPFSLTLVALIGLHQMQRDALGRLGQSGFWISVIAMSASLVGLVGIIADTDALKWLGFPLGAAGWLASRSMASRPPALEGCQGGSAPPSRSPSH